MPRTGPARTIDAERNVSRRVRIERERRGWTYEGTARRMTDVGCPVQGTTVYKIERSDPPRRITGNEISAFALIFEIDEASLMQPPELAEDELLADLLRRLAAARRQQREAEAQERDVEVQIANHLARSSSRERLDAVIESTGLAQDLFHDDAGIPLGGKYLDDSSHLVAYGDQTL